MTDTQLKIVPNPLGLKQGEKVLMDEAIEVLIDYIGFKGYLAKVTEVLTGKKWTLSIQCLSKL